MLRATSVKQAGLWNGAAADWVVLDFDGRHRRRMAMTGEGGLAFLLDLAEAEALADKLASGTWTHDYALTPEEATSLGLVITVGLPQEVLDLMKLYPAPVKQSAVEFLPFEPPGRRMG